MTDSAIPLLPILGSSGSGKTTLLSALSMRLNTSIMNVTGDIRLNGREYDATVLKSMSAYVMQDDLLHAELTVAETLMWAALLRMPMHTSDFTRNTRVEDVITLMGIGHCRDTIVGNSRRKGISGGERKRLCVAVELLNRPKLIFLDEPTSGLDSTTAFSVCKALKNLSTVGECTAICTIHQPAPLTFALFDNLILMKLGEAVFQGCLRDTYDFLQNIGKPCPEHVNLADHLIEAISPPDQSLFEKLVVPVNLSLGIEKFNFADFAQARSVLFQTSVLCRRGFKQQMRNWDTWLMGVASAVIIAFFISGGIWFQLGTDQASVTKILPALFFTCVNQGIVASLQCINSFPGERAIMLRERQSGAYTTMSYFLAKSIVDTVVLLPQPVIFTAIVYPMFGLQAQASKFFIYLAFIILDSMAATALATAGMYCFFVLCVVLQFMSFAAVLSATLMINLWGIFIHFNHLYVVVVTCLCVTVELSTVALSLLFEICRLYGGFFTSPAQLTDQYENWK